MSLRKICIFEVEQALAKGVHDRARSRYSSDHQAWQYSIEGSTLDGRTLRIGVSFKEEEPLPDKFLLIITAIDVSK